MDNDKQRNFCWGNYGKCGFPSQNVRSSSQKQYMTSTNSQKQWERREDQSYSNEINWKIRTKANHKSLFWSRCWNDVFNDEKTGKQSNNEVAKQIIAVKSQARGQNSFYNIQEGNTHSRWFILHLCNRRRRNKITMENRSTVVYLADATDVMIMWFLKRFIVWALISGHDLFIAYCT